ncbi:hypothetical protein ACFYPX_18040 [Micromonospora zamorensis]|uniref:hypothetical protein n=1 Tax=Micromonospora zamorensis TaxID=709883 RepID=UPI0036932337
MSVTIPDGVLGRPAAHFLAAVDICAAEWRRDNDNLWVGGMVAAGWWICGYTPHPPMQPDREVTATFGEVAEQMRMAGTATLDNGGPGTAAATWARGVYRMLNYAIGYTDELPLLPATRRTPARS